jgi:hypothetical protein
MLMKGTASYDTQSDSITDLNHIVIKTRYIFTFYIHKGTSNKGMLIKGMVR